MQLLKWIFHRKIVTNSLVLPHKKVRIPECVLLVVILQYFERRDNSDRNILDGGYEIVFVAGINSQCRNMILKYCEEEGIRGFFLPHVGDNRYRKLRNSS